MSYNGQMNFGLLGDFDALPDIDSIGESIAAELATLVALAREQVATPADRRAHCPSRRSTARRSSHIEAVSVNAVARALREKNNNKRYSDNNGTTNRNSPSPRSCSTSRSGRPTTTRHATSDTPPLTDADARARSAVTGTMAELISIPD